MCAPPPGGLEHVTLDAVGQPPRDVAPQLVIVPGVGQVEQRRRNIECAAGHRERDDDVVLVVVDRLARLEKVDGHGRGCGPG